MFILFENTTNYNHIYKDSKVPAMVNNLDFVWRTECIPHNTVLSNVAKW